MMETLYGSLLHLHESICFQPTIITPAPNAITDAMDFIAVAAVFVFMATVEKPPLMPFGVWFDFDWMSAFKWRIENWATSKNNSCWWTILFNYEIILIQKKKQFARIIAITIEIVDDDDGWGIESQGSLQN